MTATDFLSPKQTEALSLFEAKFEELYENPLYKHKYVVVADGGIAGFFDSFENAVAFAAGRYQQGDYIVQQVIRDNEIVNFLYPALAA
jgi:hypothetical protein